MLLRFLQLLAQLGLGLLVLRQLQELPQLSLRQLQLLPQLRLGLQLVLRLQQLLAQLSQLRFQLNSAFANLAR